MNILRATVLSFIFLIANFYSFAGIPKEIIKKTLKATSEFETYSITYSRHFKYPNEADTVKEVYKSTISRTDLDMYVGWYLISYQRSDVLKSIAAANNAEVCRLNYKDNLYYSQSYKDNPSKFIANLKSYLYQPLLISKQDLEQYSVKSEDNSVYVLQKSDTTRDQKKRVTLITKTELTISKSTWLPIREQTFSYRNGRVQYSSFELLKYNLLSNKDYSRILASSDSFINIIKQNDNGDSLKSARRDQYKKMKVGDSANMFKAGLSSGTAFDLGQYKDSVIILDFFYTTCAPCVASIPELNKIHEEFKGRGVVLFGINPFDTDWDHLPNFINDYSVHYPIVKTGKQVVYDYGVTGYPRMYIIKNGIIVKIYYGFAKGMDAELSKLLESLIK